MAGIGGRMLSRIKVAEGMRVENARAASFFVYQDNEEPSSQLPGTFAEERFVAIAGTPGRLRKVLSITTMRQSHYRADSGADIKYVYRARLSFTRAMRAVV